MAHKADHGYKNKREVQVIYRTIGLDTEGESTCYLVSCGAFIVLLCSWGFYVLNVCCREFLLLAKGVVVEL